MYAQIVLVYLICLVISTLKVTAEKTNVCEKVHEYVVVHRAMIGTRASELPFHWHREEALLALGARCQLLAAVLAPCYGWSSLARVDVIRHAVA